MKGVLNDVKHALRLYRRTPGASLGVVLVLAIGMAFVAAFLSLYADLLLRPDRGFEPGSRIVSVGWYDGRNTGKLTRELVQQLSREATTLEQVAGSSQLVFYVGAEKKYTLGVLVTRDFFPGIRPRLALGRGFSEAEHDEEGEPVVVISWQYWQDQLDGRPDVLGETLQIEAPSVVFPAPPASAEDKDRPRNFRIVGVTDKTFTGLDPPSLMNTQSSFWIPVERALSLYPAAVRPQIAAGPSWRVVARRAPGISNAAVINELNQRFAIADFIQRAGAQYDVSDGLVTNIKIRRETRRQLQVFLGASVLLALVAATNVSLFLLARAPGRRRELAIRMAMGASMRRLARQLLNEAAVLVAVASVLGLALSLWVAKWLPTLPFLREAQWTDVTLLDWRVLTLVALFLVLATLLVSLAPIVAMRRMGIEAGSRLIAARATLGQRIACTTQIAVAGVLGGAAIAFVWYLASLLLAYPGYNTRNLYAVPYAISYRTSTVDGVQTTQGGPVEAARIRESFLAVPGITALSQAMVAPGVQSPNAGDGVRMVTNPGSSDEGIGVRVVPADSHFVGVLGMKILHGGNLVEGDPGGALVNQSFAREFFGREDVAGEPVPDAVSQAAGRYVRDLPTQIVGVVEDVPFGNPLAGTEPMILSSASSSYGGLVLIESPLPLSSLQKQIRETADKIGLSLSGNIAPLAKARSDMLAPDRARGLLIISAATIVLLLAAFGFYGTQRYLVMAGRREYAIRAAVGATPAALGRLVLHRGLRLAIPGTLLALPLGVAMVAWLRDYYIPRSISPYAVAVVAALCLMVLAMVASIGPARVARRTQPAQLLREG